ncbi:MAG: hypothetical protein GY842_24190 [bacterium]|nr:hypothetical protein [bacterium]
MINWFFFPKSSEPAPLVKRVVASFESVADDIDSEQEGLKSNEVLQRVCPHLEKVGFQVETGKKALQRILVPVLFGQNGEPEKTFEADAYHDKEGFVVEVEAGRAVANNQFLKDLFQACMMQDVRYLAIAVRNRYRGSKDFESVARFFETLYASNRLALPLEGVLILGY